MQIPDEEYVNDGDEVILNDKVFSKIEIPEEFTAYTDKETISREAHLTTGEIAQMLGVHRNNVINYTNVFFDYLAAVKNPLNNRYKYTIDAVKQLAFLFNDRLNNNRTMRQELEYIQSKVGGKTINVATRNVETLELLFNTMQNNIIESNRQFLAKNMNIILKQLQVNEQLRIESADREKESFEKIEQKITEQKKLFEELISEKNQEIEKLKTELQEKDELLAKKKKRIFPW